MLTRGLVYVLIALTVAMMMLGATVHATGSSLACPDWPTCYGTLNPKMEGGVFWEHSHRLLGTLIGLGVMTLMGVLIFGARTDRERFRGFGVTFGLIVVQAGLVGFGVSQLVAWPVGIAAFL